MPGDYYTAELEAQIYIRDTYGYAERHNAEAKRIQAEMELKEARLRVEKILGEKAAELDRYIWDRILWKKEQEMAVGLDDPYAHLSDSDALGKSLKAAQAIQQAGDGVVAHNWLKQPVYFEATKSGDFMGRAVTAGDVISVLNPSQAEQDALDDAVEKGWFVYRSSSKLPLPAMKPPGVPPTYGHKYVVIVKLNDLSILSMLTGHPKGIVPYTTTFPDRAKLLDVWYDSMTLYVYCLIGLEEMAGLELEGKMQDQQGYERAVCLVVATALDMDPVGAPTHLPYLAGSGRVKPTRSKTGKQGVVLPAEKALLEALRSGKGLEAFEIG